MKRPRVHAATFLVAIALTGASVQQAHPALAEPPQEPASATVALVEEAAGEPATPSSIDDDSIETSVPGGTISIATDPSDGLTVSGPSGASVTLGVPGNGADNGAMVGGSVLFEEVAPDADIVARPTAGGAQALIVISSAEAPTEYVFPVRVGVDDAVLATTADGHIEVTLPGSSTPEAVVEPAWATDAAGRTVPTHFETRGNDLVQVVDHRDANYPVVADPQFTWGWVTGTLYFTRAETKKASTAIGLVSVVFTACAQALVTGPFAVALCGGIAAHAAVIAIYANHAYNDGKCLKIKVPVFEPGTVKRGDRNCK